jgi:hypothetical protein
MFYNPTLYLPLGCTNLLSSRKDHQDRLCPPFYLPTANNPWPSVQVGLDMGCYSNLYHKGILLVIFVENVAVGTICRGYSLFHSNDCNSCTPLVPIFFHIFLTSLIILRVVSFSDRLDASSDSGDDFRTRIRKATCVMYESSGETLDELYVRHICNITSLYKRCGGGVTRVKKVHNL